LSWLALSTLPRQQAQATWAPAWLDRVGLFQTARAWGAAVPYAPADPGAAVTMTRCEDRLRDLHPYAPACYDRLRAEGEPRMRRCARRFRCPAATLTPGPASVHRPDIPLTAYPPPGVRSAKTVRRVADWVLLGCHRSTTTITRR
jgi:hypothetical protein